MEKQYALYFEQIMYEIAKRITDGDDRLAFYDAVTAYAYDDAEPVELPLVAEIAFITAKASIDRSKAAYTNGIKGANRRWKDTECPPIEDTDRGLSNNEIAPYEDTECPPIEGDEKNAIAYNTIQVHNSTLQNNTLPNNTLQKTDPYGISLAEEQQIIDAWNAIGLAKVSTMAESRRRKLRLRVKEIGLDRFIEAIQKIPKSKFLNGNNDKGWRCSFDWLIENDRNVLKVLEGNYRSEKVSQNPVLSALKKAYQEPLEVTADVL